MKFICLGYIDESNWTASRRKNGSDSWTSASITTTKFPQEGGGYHMSFTNFGTGHSHSFESTFMELILGERIRIADKFDDASLAGNMTKTITLRAVSCAPRSRSCTKACRQPSLLKCVTSAGRSRSCNSPISLSRKSRTASSRREVENACE